eukprot:scaffold2495_cov101-Isochrysis_galbana.AAC.15
MSGRMAKRLNLNTAKIGHNGAPFLRLARASPLSRLSTADSLSLVADALPPARPPPLLQIPAAQ